MSDMNIRASNTKYANSNNSHVCHDIFNENHDYACFIGYVIIEIY